VHWRQAGSRAQRRVVQQEARGDGCLPSRSPAGQRGQHPTAVPKRSADACRPVF